MIRHSFSLDRSIKYFLALDPVLKMSFALLGAGRLLAELLAGVLIYVAYLRLGHPDMYRQTRDWIKSQLQPLHH